ncbi:MAG TPA: hypothetical protein VGQ83_35100 [Polyangia bacterium]|jgi:hypothetical protein
MAPAVEKIVKRLVRLARLCEVDAPASFIDEARDLVAEARAQGGEAAWAEAQEHLPLELERARLAYEGASAILDRCLSRCIHCDSEVPGPDDVDDLGPDTPWCRAYSLGDAPALRGASCPRFRPRN